MGHIVATNPYIALGGVGQSAHCKSMVMTWTDALQDDTCFGDTMTQRLNGVQDFKLALEFNNDHVDDDLNEDLDALMGTSFAVAARPVNTTIGAGNPEYQISCAIASMTKNYVQGQVVGVSLSLEVATSGLTRDVTP